MNSFESNFKNFISNPKRQKCECDCATMNFIPECNMDITPSYHYQHNCNEIKYSEKKFKIGDITYKKTKYKHKS